MSTDPSWCSVFYFESTQTPCLDFDRPHNTRPSFQKQNKDATMGNLCGLIRRKSVSGKELQKSQDYETIIVSSICRHSHRVRRTTGGSSGSGRNWWLHLRPIRENCRGMGAWKPGLQELDHGTTTAAPVGPLRNSPNDQKPKRGACVHLFRDAATSAG